MTGGRRGSRGRLRAAALGVAVLAVVLTASCGQEGTAIMSVDGDPSSRELGLGIASCNAESISTDVEETDDVVRILVVTEGGDDGAECADFTRVTLDAVLGSREVVDRSTGDPVHVTSPDG